MYAKNGQVSARGNFIRTYKRKGFFSGLSQRNVCQKTVNLHINLPKKRIKNVEEQTVSKQMESRSFFTPRDGVWSSLVGKIQNNSIWDLGSQICPFFCAEKNGYGQNKKYPANVNRALTSVGLCVIIYLDKLSKKHGMEVGGL